MIHLITQIECLEATVHVPIPNACYEESAPPMPPRIHDIANPVLYTYAQIDAGESFVKNCPSRLCLEDLPNGVDGEGG